MLAGEYPFEKEIDEAVKKGDLKEVKEFMKIFYEKIGNSGSVTHSLTIQEAIDKKLKKTDIPEPFKKLIVNCIQEYCRDGESLKRDFEESVTQCFEAKVKKKAVDEFKSKLKKKLVAGLATGTVLAGLGLGLAWVAYLAPRPDYSKRTDITTRVEMRNFKDSGVSFEIDKAYENNQLDVKKTDTYKNLADMHRMRFKDKSLVDKMVSVWIKTASEFNEFVDGHDLIAPIDYQARGTELSPGTFSGMGAYFLNDYLRELLAYGISINQTRKNVADLEDTLATTYLGTNLVLKAQKAANSFEVDKYLSAKDESGKYLIHEARQRFLKKLIYNISTDKELSQNIHLK